MQWHDAERRFAKIGRIRPKPIEIEIAPEAALAIAQAPPPAPLAPGVAENYDRAPDPTKVQIATAAPVDRDVVTAFVHSIAREANLLR